jgi:tetratricopeptide (TPR) repeat protein/ADP-heptose:LPS heptosyltransferase
MTKSIDQLLRKAQAYINIEERVQAEEIYKYILSRFPKNKKALRGYAELNKPPQALINNLIGLFNKNSFKETIIIGRELCERFPKSPILLEILGAANLSIDNDIDALNLYKKLLLLQPKHTDAWNNIGLIYYKLNYYEKAVEAYQNVVRFEPSFANAHFNLGNTLRKLSKPKDACDSYSKSLAINPNDSEVLTNYGHALQQCGELSKAAEYYQYAIDINPSLSDVRAEIEIVLEKKNTLDRIIDDLIKLEKCKPNTAPAIFIEAITYEKAGYNEAALDRYKLVCELEPNHKKAYLNVGLIQNESHNYQAAIDSFGKAIKMDPNIVDAYYGLARAQLAEGHIDAALENCKAANATKPDVEEVFDLMGSIQLQQGDLDAAVTSFKKALAINPDSARYYNNIGVTYYRKGDLYASIEAHEEAVKFDPESSHAHLNLGAMYKHVNDRKSALECYNMAIELDPENITAHWNQACLHLSQKDFQEGWDKYEWRWKALENMSFISSYKQVWSGEKNKRVLVWSEQGIGDEIMFASIISDLHAVCSRLIVVVDERLIPLFNRSLPNNIDFRPKSTTVAENEYDYHVPMGSLPRFFRQNAKNFKATSRGWLTASEPRTQELREKFTKDGTKVLIGISWHSTRPRDGAESKVISLSQLAKKLNGPKVKLVSLQYGDVNTELTELKEKTNIDVLQVHEIDNMKDIDGLSSLIMACDRVVSISNATIHLAGALGKKSDALIAFSSDWRWGNERDRGYWYDSVRLCRQTEYNNWDTSIAQL